MVEKKRLQKRARVRQTTFVVQDVHGGETDEALRKIRNSFQAGPIGNSFPRSNEDETTETLPKTELSPPDPSLRPDPPVQQSPLWIKSAGTKSKFCTLKETLHLPHLPQYNETPPYRYLPRHVVPIVQIFGRLVRVLP